MNKKPTFNGPEKKQLPKREFTRKAPVGAKVRYQKPKKETLKKVTTATPTSWDSVAPWYNNHLEKDTDSYHAKVVHPNLLRMLGDLKGRHVLDLACGQGVFSRQLVEKGAFVIGADIGKELIALAEKNNKDLKFQAHYFTTPSHDLYMVKNNTQDILICVLAIQNIDKLQETIGEISRVLKSDGRVYIVLNHPSFRNPTHTHWGYDENDEKQYRRIEQYISESKIKIDMTPGSRSDKKFTVSFHRPLQVYVKAFAKYNLAITRLEEWVSHRESEKGPRQRAENISRKEIPLFMAIELKKLAGERSLE